jgi:hypothetical protein
LLLPPGRSNEYDSVRQENMRVSTDKPLIQYLQTEIVPGNTVKHLHGGPDMKVVWVAMYGDKLAASCEWAADYDSFSGKDNVILPVTALGKLAD